MKKILFVLLSIVLVLGFVGCDKATPIADGEKLVRSLWSDFNSNDEAVFKNWIADGFQSVHEDKARSKNEEVKVLMALHLGEYTLDDFKTTQNENVIVVTYTVVVHETIDGKVLPTAPAERLSAFMYDGNTWKWIAHANLNSMNK
ncbi:MAG: nuclear transport factor 2 family protein [Candidatus Marinimicrobia bacterium]|nr:nuclear transport factor 2 family protein [Candidatus Neomarinimicrobiota bacterium]